MVALVATRRNPAVREFYERPLKADKPKKVAFWWRACANC
jgi:hypothetical protein